MKIASGRRLSVSRLLRPLALLVLAAALWAGAEPARAQRVPPSPVGVIIVDIQQAQRDSLPGKSLAAQRDKYQQKFQDEFNSARLALRHSDEELAKQKGTIPQDVYDQKVKALEKKVVAFQNRTQMAVRALEKSTDAAMAELMNAVLTVTGEIASEMGANLVLPKQQVILHEPRMDVTAQVIERLNSKLPAVHFPPPQVEALAPQDSDSPNPGKK